MSKPVSIFCKNIGREIDVCPGESLDAIARRMEGELGFRPMCAIVNNKTESLRFEVFRPKEVEFLPPTISSGNRTYIRSLSMMLYRAVYHLWPGAKLHIGQNISRGHFCSIEGMAVTQDMVDRLLAEMRRLRDADLPFERYERRTAEVIEVFRQQGLDDKVRLLSTYHEPYKTYYVLDGVADSYYGALAMTTADLKVFDLKHYKHGFLLMGIDPENPDVPQQPVTQEKLYKAFTDYQQFNRIVGVNDVGELNDIVNRGGASTLINVAEALHEKAIGTISEEIARRYAQGGARIVLIAGPSSSGKTTTTRRLAVQLLTQLLRPKMISLDDYFIDREHTPRDASGDYDFESLYALDLEQFNSDLQRILAGEEVALPNYSFELGRRVASRMSLRLDPGDVLLIEGIHGLNPELTGLIPEEMKYRVYVSALTTLSIDNHNWIPTTDNRLLRRIIRDYKYRGTPARDTIRRWPSVRRGEERWIFPYQENADAAFNSSLLFELGVMRSFADDILSRIPHDCPEYCEAYRLRRFMSYFEPIDPKAVPPTSLLREFLGGSSLHY